MWYSNIKASRELIWEYVDPEKSKDELPLLIKLVKPMPSKYKDRVTKVKDLSIEEQELYQIDRDNYNKEITQYIES